MDKFEVGTRVKDKLLGMAGFMKVTDFKIEQKVKHETWGDGVVLKKEYSTKLLIVKFKYPLPIEYNCGSQLAYCKPEELEIIE